ncbi:MAG: hypothetical protein IKM11_03300 [Oscillospiraceae bacterium]|nr:hypothetical protein [Oscillospiraceae bacterium]
MKETLQKVLRKEMIINFVINAVIGAFFAFMLNRKAERVATDFVSTLIDLLISTHFPALFTAGFSGIFAKGYAKQGIYSESYKLAKFPRNPLLFGLVLAELSVVIGVIVLGGGFTLIGIDSMPLWVFILYKTAHGGVVGMIVANLAQRRFLLKPRT